MILDIPKNEVECKIDNLYFPSLNEFLWSWKQVGGLNVRAFGNFAIL